MERFDRWVLEFIFAKIVPVLSDLPVIPDDKQWKLAYLGWRERGKIQLRRFAQDLAVGQYGQIDPVVIKAIRYNAIDSGGKRVRMVLVYLIHQLVGGHFGQIDLASLLAELPHRGSLIEDDIDDHSVQRDGRPAVHITFGHSEAEGRQIAMAAANLLYQAPVLILERMDIPASTRTFLLKEYQRLTAEAREGQRLDLLWTTSRDVPTPEEYLEMCRLKCAAFEFALLVGATFSQANAEQTRALLEMGRLAAVSFQLVDDRISFQPGADDYLADLKEGKPTYPILAGLHQNTIESYQLQLMLEKLWGRRLNVRRPPHGMVDPLLSSEK